MSTQIDAKPKPRPRGPAKRLAKGVKWNNAVGGADEQYQLKKQAVIAEASRTFGRHGYKNVSLDEIAAALARRKEARAAKDFAASDAIRDELGAQGVEVMDGDPLGWEWKLT